MSGSQWVGVMLAALVIAAATASSVWGGVAPGLILAGVLVAFEMSVIALGLIAGALTL